MRRSIHGWPLIYCRRVSFLWAARQERLSVPGIGNTSYGGRQLSVCRTTWNIAPMKADLPASPVEYSRRRPDLGGDTALALRQHQRGVGGLDYLPYERRPSRHDADAVRRSDVDELPR